MGILAVQRIISESRDSEWMGEGRDFDRRGPEVSFEEMGVRERCLRSDLPSR